MKKIIITFFSLFALAHASVNSDALGLTESDFNYLMALSGLLMGFIFAFGLVIAFQNIGKGK